MVSHLVKNNIMILVVIFVYVALVTHEGNHGSIVD